MKITARLGIIILLASFFTIGLVEGAASEWLIGDEVKLIVTTTNMGDVDVRESNGMIMVRTEAGTRYDAGFFRVEGVVRPGESVEVPLNWDSTDAPPGYYDIILDGVLTYANGEYEDTYSEVEDAFLLIDPNSGLREVPEVFTDGYISGITLVSDTYFEGSQFITIIWLNNTGTTLFIPEIVLDFHGEDYDSGPLTEIFVDNPCEPGVEPYLMMCQLPEDMEAGDYQCDVELNMHYLDVEIIGPQETESLWLDSWTSQEADQDADTLLYRWIYGGEQFAEDESYYYDLSAFVEETEDWPSSDYSDGYCFRWFYDGEQVAPDPNDEIFCEEVVDPIYNEYQLDFLFNKIEVEIPEVTLYSFTPEEPVLGIEPGEWWWTWEPATGDEGYHEIYVEVRERTVDYEVDGAWVLDPLAFIEEPLPVYIKIENTGGYAFEPEFTVYVPELDLPLDFILEQEPIAPVGTCAFELDVDVSDVLPSDEGYQIEVSTDIVQIFEETGSDTVPSGLGYRFLLDWTEETVITDWLHVQDDYAASWGWSVVTEAWESPGTHTLVVEVTDLPVDPEYRGEGDRIGFATLEVTVTEDDQGDTTDDSGTITDTEGEEPEPEAPPEEEPSSGPLGIIQSLIESIMNFFKSLFG